MNCQWYFLTIKCHWAICYNLGYFGESQTKFLDKNGALLYVKIRRHKVTSVTHLVTLGPFLLKLGHFSLKTSGRADLVRPF